MRRFLAVVLVMLPTLCSPSLPAAQASTGSLVITDVDFVSRSLVRISGTVTCAPDADFVNIYLALHQRRGQKEAHAVGWPGDYDSAGYLTCTGQPASWTADLPNLSPHPFRRGPAKLSVLAANCYEYSIPEYDEEGINCGSVIVEQLQAVRLK